MELIQIIESTVFIFSLGLLVLLIMSYLLFKVKNRSVSFPLDSSGRSDDIRITYERLPQQELASEEPKNNLNDRFIVVNETLKESDHRTVNKKQSVNPRFYIYKPIPDRIAALQVVRIKEN
ncbi:MAG TPA: hypothetical protein VKD08_11520 [Ignavibacteriaceae bacterium]|jgi:hypothetical protein|nr:hypothetical protein [Ignavibacteriaceae bacterium]